MGLAEKVEGVISPFRQTVSEADVDWIVCIELNSNAQFRQWFAKAVFGSGSIEHDQAWRSISSPESGESDLVWLVRSEDGHSVMALVENKISAIAQPEQYVRYVWRGERYVEKNICNEFRTVLISPEGYVSRDSANYQVHVSYESLKAWFGSREGERSKFITSIFEAAIHKSRILPTPDPAITAYREQVWRLANFEFPALKLVKPGPTREYWVSQGYDGVLMRYKTFSNVREGFYGSVVDMELPGQAGDLEQLRAEYGRELSGLGAKVVKAGKSAAFRIDVLCAKPPEFDVVATRRALQAWETLLNWWKSRRLSVC
jgi:hypothetical protein